MIEKLKATDELMTDEQYIEKGILALQAFANQATEATPGPDDPNPDDMDPMGG